MLQMQSKEVDGVSMAIDQGRLNIGRDSVNDLVLSEPGEGGYHTSVFFENGRTEQIYLGSTNGTIVNGQRIVEPHELKARDTVRIGKSEFEVGDPTGRRPTMVQSTILETPFKNLTFLPISLSKIDSGNSTISTFRLISSGTYPHCLPINSNITIGRGVGNSLSLKSPSVSSRHAEIAEAEGEMNLINLQRTNGTYVNGRRMTRQRVRHGDVLRFDGIEYRLELAETDTDGEAKTIVNPTLQPDSFATVLNPAAEEATSGRSAKKPPQKHSASSAKSTDVEVPVQFYAGLAADHFSSSRFSVTLSCFRLSLTPQEAAYTSVRKYLPSPERATDNPCSCFLWLFFSIEGQINRISYLLGGLATSGLLSLAGFMILPVVVGSVAFGSYAVIGVEIIVSYIALFVFLAWLGASLAAKRLHDMNQSAHFLWIFLLPPAWVIMPFVLLFSAFTPGPNRYGPLFE